MTGSTVQKLGIATLALTLCCSAAALAAPGDLDPTFDGDGIRRIDYGGASDKAGEVLVQPDGKIVIAGSGYLSNNLVVTRLNRDGSDDPSFDGDGVIDINFGGNEVGQAAALQPDGKIIVAGSSTLGMNAALMRLNANGSLDTSFDGDGKTTFNYGGVNLADAVLVQPDGKIVVAGLGNTNNDLAVTRLNPDGSSDSSFDGDGVIGIEFGGIDNGYAVALQADGKIVVAGTTTTEDDIAVIRLNANGSPDAAFDGDGKQTVDLQGTDGAGDVLIQPDGKIVLAGYDKSDFAVVRMNPDGSLDPGLDGDGIVNVEFGGVDAGTAATLQANGKIVVVGASGGQGAVSRLQPGGSLDTTFSGDGKYALPAASFRTAITVALQADGRIALAGAIAGDMPVARLEGDPIAAGGGPPGGGGPGGAPGGAVRSVPHCAGKRATIVGSSRRDRLRGTRRADVIVALGGNDSVKGGRGNDRVCAGTGNDNINGDSGNDRIYGQSGKDKLKGGTGNDRLDGGPSNDRIDGQSGKDRLTGGKGRDRCTGGPGRDRATCERRKSI